MYVAAKLCVVASRPYVSISRPTPEIIQNQTWESYQLAINPNYTHLTRLAIGVSPAKSSGSQESSGL
jgi:hypothetical protein